MENAGEESICNKLFGEQERKLCRDTCFYRNSVLFSMIVSWEVKGTAENNVVFIAKLLLT